MPKPHTLHDPFSNKVRTGRTQPGPQTKGNYYRKCSYNIDNGDIDGDERTRTTGRRFDRAALALDFHDRHIVLTRTERQSRTLERGSAAYVRPAKPAHRCACGYWVQGPCAVCEGEKL